MIARRGLFLAVAFAMIATCGQAVAAAPKCVSNEAFLVVEAPHKDGVGNRYIVRDNRATQKPACSTRKAPGDQTIGAADDPYFLLKLAGPYLLIDSGTGPDRDLIIRDLANGKTLFSGGYSDDDVKIDASHASFWATSDQKPTKRNCPDLASITASGLTPVIEAEASFDFATGKVTRSGKSRCSAHQ